MYHQQFPTFHEQRLKNNLFNNLSYLSETRESLRWCYSLIVDGLTLTRYLVFLSKGTLHFYRHAHPFQTSIVLHLSSHSLTHSLSLFLSKSLSFIQTLFVFISVHLSTFDPLRQSFNLSHSLSIKVSVYVSLSPLSEFIFLVVYKSLLFFRKFT